jgi:hypothetical protein
VLEAAVVDHLLNVTPVALIPLMVTPTLLVAFEATLAVMIGVTPVVNDTGNVNAREAVNDVVTPQIILYGMPSITLVLSCAAVSVLPAVNVNLPDISK